MSASPTKETDVEQGVPSDNNSEPMDRADPEAQARERELAYEFEVKEQDRWLPIANGWFFMLPCPPIIFAYMTKLRTVTAR